MKVIVKCPICNFGEDAKPQEDCIMCSGSGFIDCGEITIKEVKPEDILAQSHLSWPDKITYN